MADSKEAKGGYSIWELPEGQYIVCSFEAEDFEHLVMDAIYKAHRYLFQTWLPNHNLISKPFAAERYASHSADTTRMEIWVLI
uniref:GyrI-like domain-containing protein n=1 Tax=Aminipila terrae TaxID=2697030 RepID=UPI0038B88074